MPHETSRTMKTPISYYGGKQMLASAILRLIPPHTTYCEPFFGGGAVFFAKQKSHVEIINDLNQFVVNFYLQAQSNFHTLDQKIQQTPHSRRLYRDAMVMYEHPHLFTDMDRAWALWVLCNQGYASKIGSWAFGTIDNSSEKKTDNAKARLATGDMVARLDRVQIECTDALYLLRLRDRDTTFFYLDPPYFNSNMGHYGGYTEGDFEALLQACAGLQGKFLLSSYPSDVLDRYTREHGWYQVEKTDHVRASTKRKSKTEVLTANYPLPALKI